MALTVPQQVLEMQQAAIAGVPHLGFAGGVKIGLPGAIVPDVQLDPVNGFSFTRSRTDLFLRAPLPTVLEPTAPTAPTAPIGGVGGVAVPSQQLVIGGAISLGIWLVRLLPQITVLSVRFGVSVTRVISWIRRNVFMIAKTAGWVAAGLWLSDILNLDQDEGMRTALEISGEGEKKKRRRLTIGHNPRARTLLRVARFTAKLLKRQQKMFKEFFPATSRRGELKARERAHHRIISKGMD